MCKTEKHYLYIAVREDLSRPQQVVQAGHAILEATLQFKHLIDHQPHFVVVGAKDKDELISMMSHFLKNDIRVVPFQEEDMDFQITAFVSEPIHHRSDLRDYVRHFPLLQ